MRAKRQITNNNKPITQKKPRAKKFKNDERACVNKLIKTLHEISPDPLYIYVDRDSKQRVFKSGWDFLVSRSGKVIFCEAKRTKTYSKDSIKLLSSFQTLTSLEIENSQTGYFILEFIDDDERIMLTKNFGNKSSSFVEMYETAARFLLTYL